MQTSEARFITFATQIRNVIVRRWRNPYKALGRQEPALDILPRFGAIRSHRGVLIIFRAVSRMYGNRRTRAAAT